MLIKAHDSNLQCTPEAPKEFYWWPGMKKEVVEFVATCGICQQVNVEHQKLAGKLQPLLILEWKWEDISMDFVSRLLKGMKGNDVI